MRSPFRILCWLCIFGLIAAPIRETNASDLQVARQLNNAFVEVAAQVMPSVVVITAHLPPPDLSRSETDSNQSRRRNSRRFRDGDEESIGSGSRVIIRKDGYIVTNRHVVEDADRIEVRLKDGRKFAATVRGMDPQSDVAVLKIAATNLPAAKFADTSKTRVGEFAIAIGAPFQFDYSVTFGHVSAKSRDNVLPRNSNGAALDQDYLQTDANINPGNSGGPLVNLDGEVMGINTVIRGINTGIGFAIPAQLVKEVAEQLIRDGKFTRAWLGVSIVALSEDDAYRELLQDLSAGVVIRAVIPDGPAARANLQASDVILAVEGKPVATPQELRNEIRTRKLGTPVRLTVQRGGKKQQFEILPAEWAGVSESKPTAPPNTNSVALAPAKLGMEIKALTAELAGKFHVAAATAGVIVTKVEGKSAAERCGIAPGDIITAIDQQPTPTPRRYREALRNADLAKGVVVNLTTANVARFEILQAAGE